MGFNMESLKYNNINFQVWDLGGQTTVRPYWKCYYPNAKAVVFVIDSSDKKRIETVKNQLDYLMKVY